MTNKEIMFKVQNGQDPYSAIGNYIQNHVECIENMIAIIEINGAVTKQLLVVDITEDGYFVWQSDWYEGEKDVALIDFFPVRDAQPERKKGVFIGTEYDGYADGNPVYYEWKCSEYGDLQAEIQKWSMDDSGWAKAVEDSYNPMKGGGDNA